jgi:hypothetical protein
VNKNTTLRKLFGPKKTELPGGWRRLHKDSFMIFTHTKYYLEYLIKEGELDMALGTFGGEKRTYMVFVGKPKEKGSLGKK